MQPTSSGSSSGGVGGGGGGGGGGERLARFRSTPASWLETLLKDEDDDPLNTNQCFTQLLVGGNLPSSRNSESFESSGVGGSSTSGFFRQNSSPAEFFGNSMIGSEGYLSNSKYGASSSNYNYVSQNIDVASMCIPIRQKVEHSGKAPDVEKEMEKILEDSVPCRVRAKRGCATHPRSIAERVRRTRISDRIRRLQELVPNMDKQTNTADMLEEAVAYVKNLQRQIEELLEHQRRCKCKSKE